jgi:hypothetical protein
VHGEPLAPPRSPVARAEVEPGAKWLGGIFPAIQQPDRRLGQNQRDVALQPIPQAPTLVGELVLSRREIHPYLTVPDLNREDARLVGELVEGPAALQVEAGVVPVAGQDTVPDAPPVQGESHVGTAIVHGVYPAVVEEERE